MATPFIVTIAWERMLSPTEKQIAIHSGMVIAEDENQAAMRFRDRTAAAGEAGRPAGDWIVMSQHVQPLSADYLRHALALLEPGAVEKATVV
jgi:hypothetical protein